MQIQKKIELKLDIQDKTSYSVFQEFHTAKVEYLFKTTNYKTERDNYQILLWRLLWSSNKLRSDSDSELTYNHILALMILGELIWSWLSNDSIWKVTELLSHSTQTHYWSSENTKNESLLLQMDKYSTQQLLSSSEHKSISWLYLEYPNWLLNKYHDQLLNIKYSNKLWESYLPYLVYLVTENLRDLYIAVLDQDILITDEYGLQKYLSDWYLCLSLTKIIRENIDSLNTPQIVLNRLKDKNSQELVAIKEIDGDQVFTRVSQIVRILFNKTAITVINKRWKPNIIKVKVEEINSKQFDKVNKYLWIGRIEFTDKPYGNKRKRTYTVTLDMDQSKTLIQSLS